MYGIISDPLMRLYPTRVALTLRTSGWDFHTSARRYRPGGPPCSSPVRRNCRCMELFLIREWDLILPRWRWVYEPRVGVSKPCGAVSTQATTVFVPGSSELQMYGIIYD